MFSVSQLLEIQKAAKEAEYHSEKCKRKAEEMKRKLYTNKHNEEYLRKHHPAVREAWEQYQIVLKLAK